MTSRLTPFIVLTACNLVGFAAGADALPSPADPHHVLGVEQCAKCHQSEIEVWKRTPHFRTFEELHRRPEAKQISKKLGLRSIKRNTVCTQCHYTQQHVNGKDKPVAGISCESCHGAAKLWLDAHHDYGGPNMTRAQETAEHHRQRRALAISKGMRNPTNIYLIAQSCLGCHTTPNEELVNVGGHSAGSQDFELVRWSQGMIRHNFSRSAGRRNDPSSIDRLRVMYVVGMMADLEYSLRATAKATKKATYGLTSARRADRNRKRLRALQEKLRDPYVQQAVDAAFRVKISLNNQAELNEAAETISRAAYAFAAENDGSSLAVLDPLLPPAATFK